MTLTMWPLALRAAEQFGASEILVDEHGRRMTFEEIVSAAERLAAGLSARGITTGTAVSWQLPTRMDALVLTLALSRLGAVQNPVLPGYAERELGFVLKQTGAVFMLAPADSAGAATVEANHPHVELIRFPDAALDGDPAGLPPFPADADRGDPVRWVFYTSGTTADPKGARHTDGSVLAGAAALMLGLQCAPGDKIGMTFPVAHIGGCTTWLGSALISGCTLLLGERFDPVGTVEYLRREGATIPGTGTAFTVAYLAAQRQSPGERIFPNLRMMTSGAAPKPPGLHVEVRAELGGMGIMSSWGMTEAPIATVTRLDDSDEVLAATEGRGAEGVELRVVDPDGTVLATGEEGELLVRGPQVMEGYLDSSLDADAFTADGFLRTGDLARLDPHGNLFITGRLKDVINRGGENISARDVELSLLEHPAVADVAVIGVPDARLGERACAVVVVADGSPTPSLAELCEFLVAGGLRKVALPERLEVIDTLPRGATGKVFKPALKKQFH